MNKIRAAVLFVLAVVAANVIAGVKAYVSKTGSNTSPYDTWEKAANDLTAALATDATEIEVGDGEFAHSVTWQVVDRPVWIHSSNGPSATTLTGTTGGHFKVSDGGALISGFTLKDTGALTASTDSDRHPIYLTAGTVSNCVVTGTLKRNQYGSICRLLGTAMMVDCDLNGSGLVVGGVGADANWGMALLSGSSVLERCRIHDWHVSSAGGKNSGFGHSAVVLLETSVMRGSLVYNNSFGDSTHTGDGYLGGAVRIRNNSVVENCTIVNNLAGGNGGGLLVKDSGVTVKNCIIWGNTSYGDGQDIYDANRSWQGFTYSCASDVGNADALPKAYNGAGCTSEDPKLDTSAARLYRLTSASSACIDKGVETSSSSADGAIDLIGNPRTLYGAVDMGCFEFLKKMYVAKNGGNVFPYDTWAKAATDLTVPLAIDTTDIEVGDGNFTNTVLRHVVDRPVFIHSSNGPTATTLTATGGHFKVTADALIAGLTLNGSGAIVVKVGGNAERCPVDLTAGCLSNCVVTGVLKRNQYASIVSLSGTARALDCDFDGSSVSFDAVGADGMFGMVCLDGSSLVERCRIHGWKARWAYSQSTYFFHSAVSVGASAILRNSLVYDNVLGEASQIAEGRYFLGGGVYAWGGTIENCTVVGNSSAGEGGGIYVKANTNPIIRNCIVWGNSSCTKGNDIYAATLPAANLTYTCASDIGNADSLPVAGIGGDGCINKDPLFTNKFGETYYLRGSSPCVDAGTSVGYPDIASAVDLRLQPRLYGSAVDMGCFELGARSGLCLIFR